MPGDELRGVSQENVPMARYTSWRAGGAAEHWYRPADLTDLSEFLHRLPSSEPVLWVGLGSNLLVRDGGLRGVVIATHSALGNLSWQQQNDSIIRIEAGVPCAQAARYCAR
jgi:UDP-N-acetylmuramate dehydrogenase